MIKIMIKFMINKLGIEGNFLDLNIYRSNSNITTNDKIMKDSSQPQDWKNVAFTAYIQHCNGELSLVNEL